MHKKIVLVVLLLLVVLVGQEIYKAVQADQALQASGVQVPWDENGEYVILTGPEAGFHVTPNSTAALYGVGAFAIVIGFLVLQSLLGAAIRKAGGAK